MACGQKYSPRFFRSAYPSGCGVSQMSLMHAFVILATTLALLTAGCAAGSKIVHASAPPGEALSEDYSVKVNRRSIPVYSCRVSAVPFNQEWPGYQRPQDQTELAGFACWNQEGPVQVEVRLRAAISSAIIRPNSLGVIPRIERDRILFTLKAPAPMILEINGMKKALHLFASPLETNAPAPNAHGVRYFGPGIHRPGVIKLRSNESVYIADGAVVHGSIQASGASNIRIEGRGILDVGSFERGQGGGAVRLTDCTDARIEGIVMRDPDVWCCSLFGCRNVTITDVKLIGLWRYNADGIDICNSENVTVQDSFVRAFDDALVVKGLKFPTNSFHDRPVRNIRFRRCVVWCDWGRAMEIGVETSAPEIAEVAFEDCDIVRTTHVAMDIFHGDRAIVHDIRFENNRVDMNGWQPRPQFQSKSGEHYKADGGDRYCPALLSISIQKTHYAKDPERGKVRNVLFKDIKVTGADRPPSILSGLDAEHDVAGVKIQNLRFNGQWVGSPGEAGLAIGPHVQEVQFTK